MTGTSPLLRLNNGVQMPALGLGVYQSAPEDTVRASAAALARLAGRHQRLHPAGRNSRLTRLAKLDSILPAPPALARLEDGYRLIDTAAAYGTSARSARPYARPGVDRSGSLSR